MNKKKIVKNGVLAIGIIVCVWLLTGYTPTMGNGLVKWFTKVLICLGYVGCVYIVWEHFEEFWEFPAEVIGSRRVILQLSRNDFKTKYAGSYLGIIWAFIQPVVTVIVYWMVFEKAMGSGETLGVPFVLWLIAGLVPWFFFSDALNGGTNALLEYQYLVKKVVFQINILPVVKVLSAMYVNLFFILFTLILYACYGYYPDWYTLQIVYYLFCTFVLVLGICYMTSAIIGFFRDLSQIINILLQVGIWVTPIMWNMEGMHMPDWLRMLFMLNPMYYIVNGFRDALISKVFFWERMTLTVYFWMIALLCLAAGSLIFKRLKVHFADVL
jgi:teichoic acid transport system permease protein